MNEQIKINTNTDDYYNNISYISNENSNNKQNNQNISLNTQTTPPLLPQTQRLIPMKM